MRIGHFALASDCYCHFTSPIRRYPDLTVHRLLEAHLRGGLDPESTPDFAAVTAQGKHCGLTERRAATAEGELRTLLVLQMLAGRIGLKLEGVITGITSFGVFVQSTRYLVEGLVRLQDLGDDWWEPNPKAGVVVAQRTGRRIRMGDAVQAQVIGVDLARRELNLMLATGPGRAPGKRRALPAEGGKPPARPGKGPKQGKRQGRTDRRRRA
jgi:ribonuclease R